EEDLRDNINNAAVQLMENIKYINAGTVEFLVSNNEYYFIEVNPRVQVEHTITEMVTGVDIVQTQLKITDGLNIDSESVGIPKQPETQSVGNDIQSRVTPADPLIDFSPDAGRIMVYRTGGGVGVRLDAGDGCQGAVISPYYDSVLVKVSTWALTLEEAAQKMV